MISNKYPTTKPSLNLDFANTKSLDPRITFRRGTPGTYYDGVTNVKAEENLFTYSEDFSEWGYGRIVQTSGQSAPDGSSNAYKIEQDSGQTTSGYLLQTHNASANKSYTFSVYAKAGTNRNYIVLRTFLSNNRFTFFDLANGLVANTAEGHVASISDAGGGWYRCSITYTPGSYSSSGVQFNVYFSDNDSSITVADDGGFIYVWGAQLEQRDFMTCYTATNGESITKYQPKLITASADSARFDHDPITGESKGLLIEGSRTNLVQDSEFIENISTNGVWWNQTATVSSVKKNQTISPTGQLSATKIIYNTNATSGGLVMKYHRDASTGDVFAGSVYLKAGNLDKVSFYFNARANSGASVASPAVIADLSLGVIESTQDSAGMTISNSSINNVGNGWYRVAMTSTVITGVDVISLGIYMSGGPTNSTTAYDHFFVWGAQMEKASSSSSYIKTAGVSATRSADNASITGENFSNWYSPSKGAIYAEILPNYNEHTGTSVLAIGGSSTNNIGFSPGISGQARFFIRTNNTTQAEIAKTGLTAGALKMCAAYANDDASFFVNSENIGQDTNLQLPLVDSELDIGQDRFNTKIFGHIKKISFYSKRLSDEQLKNLTK